MSALIWRLVERRLRRRLPAHRVDPILADLFDDYSRKQEAGRVRAVLWLVREARSLDTAYRADDRARRIALDGTFVESIARDVRLAVRTLSSKPGFSLNVVASLALGFAVVSTTVAIANAYLIRPLPKSTGREDL